MYSGSVKFMLTYEDRLKKGVIVTPYGLYKYPFTDDNNIITDNKDHNLCEVIISYGGVEACYYNYPIVADAVDDI
jgi:hypothetical protein